jgi:hypothetical protein
MLSIAERSPFSKVIFDRAVQRPHPHGQRQIRMLLYIRSSVRLTDLPLFWYTAIGFIEYTSPPVDFTSIIVLHEKHFTGPE